MTMKKTLSLLALLAAASLAACGGGGGVPSGVTTPNPGKGAAAAPTPAGGAVLVGVGDSLTFGTQSDGNLAIPYTAPSVSSLPQGLVPPGQGNGFFADFYDCLAAAGGTCLHSPVVSSVPQNPSLAVLPLINSPGLGTQLVLNSASLLTSVQSGCTTFNNEAWGQTTWAATRVNPTAGIADLGIPGLTMHQSVAMNGPVSGPPSGTSCSYPTIKGDPTSGGLQTLIESQNQMWYPILGEFQTAYGSNTTQLTVAAGMNAKMYTVWLGANDLLEYIFSGGTSPTSDTPQQMAADLTTIVKKLSATGAKVLVADLPTLMPTTGNSVPQFFPQAKFAADSATLFGAFALAVGQPSLAANAASYGAAFSTALGSTYGLTTGSYLTESGFLGAVQQGFNLILANPTAPNFAEIELDPSGAGSGLGSMYLTPAFAAKAQALNTAYNQAIDSVATSSGSNVALVPINTLFAQAATNGVATAAGTATLQFGGGLVCWDGLHPSNTGYAVIANAFIQTADTAFNMNIQQININSIVTSDLCNPNVLKAGGATTPFPLP
jgi:lysophospholipase L1-like esterase